MRKLLLASCTLAAITTTPAAAMSNKSWGHVSDAGAAALGAVMGALMKSFKGKADGAVLNRIAREELGPGQ